MKKLIVINFLLMSAVYSFQSCRTENYEEISPEFPAPTTESFTHRCSDSLCSEHLYPDPPVRDGQDWRNVSNPQQP